MRSRHIIIAVVVLRKWLLLIVTFAGAEICYSAQSSLLECLMSNKTPLASSSCIQS